MNPWFKRAEKRGDNGHGDLSEKRMAKMLGARLTPNSGAKAGAKGDMGRGKVKIEAKSTIKDKLPLDLGWLVKITHEARNVGMVPAMALSFVDAEGKPRLQGDWFVIPAYLAQDFFEFLEREG